MLLCQQKEIGDSDQKRRLFTSGGKELFGSHIVSLGGNAAAAKNMRAFKHSYNPFQSVQPVNVLKFS